MVEEQVLAAVGDNAFAVMGVVSKELRRTDRTLVGAFTAEATSGDYNHLVEVCRQWAVRIDNDDLS